MIETPKPKIETPKPSTSVAVMTSKRFEELITSLDQPTEKEEEEITAIEHEVSGQVNPVFLKNKS